MLDARFAHEAGADALDDRAQRDDRGDADRDADEEEQQPPPGRAQLARGHAQDEGHHRAAGSGTSGCRRSGSTDRAILTAGPDAFDCDTRPSRSAIATSATPASSGIVRDEHERGAAQPVDLEQQVDDLRGRSRVSRLPVGSSASRSGGSLASARAIATRCCSPPESCDG